METIRHQDNLHKIVILNPKGGCGKTMLATNLASFFAARKIDIAELNTRSYAAAHTGAPMFSVQMTINVPTAIQIAALRDEFMDFCDQLNLDAIIELARGCTRNGRPALEDAGIRGRIARADARIEAMRLNGMRFLTRQLKGEPLGSETSINKLLRAELEVELGELALAIEGSLGVLAQGDPAVPENGHWQRFALSWPEVVIGGGTPNIQKNIIAERVLGLPKD